MFLKKKHEIKGMSAGTGHIWEDSSWDFNQLLLQDPFPQEMK